ncbi:hypothetical protein VTN49DRAFT_21 [Thermomyces lanuginosus]|uniref:uncharacterized protein n=1 Tax=Thermomyces lanuginosus TaxID=5541 RepID=UPI0037432EE0
MTEQEEAELWEQIENLATALVTESILDVQRYILKRLIPTIQENLPAQSSDDDDDDDDDDGGGGGGDDDAQMMDVDATPSDVEESERRNGMIIERKLLIFLYLTAKGASYRNAVEKFQHSLTTMSSVFHQVLDGILPYLAN